MKSLLCLKVDARGYISEYDRDLFFRDQLKVLENCTCFDCGSRNPTWISLSFSVYICLNCSGKHRQLGTHISFVRSIDMDMFTPKQLVRLQLGGNRNALAYFSENGLSKQPYDYKHHKAQAYTRTLDKAVKDVISGSSEANLLFGQEDSDAERIKDPKDVKLDDLFDMVTSEATANATTDNVLALNLDLKDSFMAKSKPSPFSGGLKRDGINKPTFKSRFSSKAALDIDAFEKALKEVKESCTLDQADEVVPPPSAEATYGGVEKQNDEFREIDNRNVSEGRVNPSNLDHLKGMSGISSDVFFGRTEKQPVSYNTFNPNKTSLSSDEYFGRAPRRTPNDSSTSNPWNNLEDQALQNINELKDGLLNVIHKGNAIVEKAKLWLNTTNKF